MKYEIKCAECGKTFMSNNHSLNVFCSVGCQIARDPIDASVPPAGRGRAARTVRNKKQGD